MTMCMSEFASYKPQVGDEICIVKRTSTGKKEPVVVATKVDGVGSRYFTTEAYPSYRFSIDGKTLHKDINSFPSNYILYPSVSVYKDKLEVTKILNIIAKQLTKPDMSDSGALTNIPLADIKEVCKLLRIKPYK